MSTETTGTTGTTDAAATDAEAPAKVRVQIWSDYVCPFCMLAEGPLEEAVEGLDVEIEWKPFELRAEPKATLRPEDPYLPEIWKRAVYPMARRLGVDITLPTVSPQPYTRLAFEGWQFAVEHGLGDAYNHRMFRAFFQESLDLGRLDVLVGLAEEIGLDGPAYRKALEDGTYYERHQDALRDAEAHRVQAVPTILVGDTRLEGVPSTAQLRKAVLDERARLAASVTVEGVVCRADGTGCA